MPKPIELQDELPAAHVTAGQTPAEPKRSLSTAYQVGSAPTQDFGSPPPPPSSTFSGEQLPYPTWDRYNIVSFLGAGGMGEVYKARDPRLHRSVAIKFLRGGPKTTLDTRQRRHFDREARAQARIDHPHICKIYEVGEVDGQPYIAMQFIHGSSLAGLQPTMQREAKVRVIQKVAEALHAAHTQNLIHRDIKPANIMVESRQNDSWWPYLMDFGLAREVDSNTQTSLGGVEGTPAFMAPEQARGETRLLDPRADIYGLGATLYCVVAGRPPFVGNTTDVLVSVLLDEPPRLRTFDPAISPALETIVEKCLEKEPERRYASAQALAADLGRYLEGTRIAARPPGLLRRTGRLARRHKLLLASVTAALLATLILGGVALRIRWQAAQQARLAQHLGQEITKMEWLLRSARQLPLHNLAREKTLIRQQMEQLQTELAGYGQLSRGLAHYALGRGHMALHEYPQALTELQQAIQLDVQGAEVHYALGFVLGKHFEQAMYEARLSGGGDWARKQLKDIEPKYLTPAIASLARSRSMKLDAPQYLEGLIAYYQRDYDEALKQADTALRLAPWLYEASKLAGDVHLDRALQARDRGHYEEAEREFVGAVQSYDAAAVVGRSDGEVYEGLAEVWVRRTEMAVLRGQPAEVAYAAAMAASDQIMAVEPQSISGPLKKAFASAMTMSILSVGLNPMEPLRQCLVAAEEVLQKQPGHPYASDLASTCNLSAAESAHAHGGNPEPFLRKALSHLEPIIKRSPHFLWGINDLGNAYNLLGAHLQLHGSLLATEVLQKSVEQYSAAASLDPTYVSATANLLSSLLLLLVETRSEEGVRSLLAQADDRFAKCRSINNQDLQCLNNYFHVYARAASQAFLAGQDPQPRLARAFEYLAATRKLGGSWLDAEQYAALAHLVDAEDRVRKGHAPASALAELRADLTRCFALAAQDAMCRTLAVQAEWVQGDWLAVQNKPSAPILQAALAKARLATESPEVYPDAWQTLAGAHLRLARNNPTPLKVRDQHVADGLAAAATALSINPNHALGLATQGALQLVRAQAESNPLARRSAARAAAKALEQALQHDPLLSYSYAPVLNAAKALIPPAHD